VCAWHKNQRDMQIGLKSDEVGWDAYRICQDGAAIVATGHEHSYARTRTLIDVGNEQTGHGAYGADDTMLVSEGSNFVFVAGTAGQAYRSYDHRTTTTTRGGRAGTRTTATCGTVRCFRPPRVDRTTAR
jgi:hypothetical protein